MRQTWDLVVIGGGVNGTGIARDAAMRGMRVLLVERRDFASGSSGANSGMIHGGFRYLMNDADVTRLSCIDSGYIQRIAPHLLFRIPFLFPLGLADPPVWKRKIEDPSVSRQLHRGLGGRIFDYLLEVYFGTYDLYQPLKNGRPHTRLTRDEALELEPGLAPDIRGALSFDEYGIDPFRLCSQNGRSAASHGATIRNHTEVVGFLRGDDGAVNGVRLRRFGAGGPVWEERARIVVNAGGPWAGRIAALAGVDVRLRPGKGVHLTLDRRVSNYGVVSVGKDGRQVFVMPHESSTIVGTTDDDYYGDPDDIPITRDEVAYLLEGAAKVLPHIGRARILRTWAGVRNTAFAWGKDEDRLSREHQFLDHSRDGAPGFFTLVGGKLASFRAQSEEVVDTLAALLGVTARCRTHEVPLAAPPQASGRHYSERLSSESGSRGLGGGRSLESRLSAPEPPVGMPSHAVSRVRYRHGDGAAEVWEHAWETPDLAAIVCSCEGVIGAELVHAIRKEHAIHLVDLRRRCRLAMGPCQGARCVTPAAALLARERGLSLKEVVGEMASLLLERWRGQRGVTSGDGLAQLELTRGALLGSGALPRTTDVRPIRR